MEIERSKNSMRRRSALVVLAGVPIVLLGFVVVGLVEQGDRRYAALLAPHGFAGAHAQQVIVGTATSDVTVVVVWPDSVRTEVAVSGASGSQTIQVGC